MTARSFTYEVSMKILQYLPLEKRTIIAIFCPDVKPAERKAKLCLDHLLLDDRSLTINDDSYHFYHVDYQPGKCSVQIEQGTYGITFTRHVDMKIDDAMKKLFDFWLGDRGVVKVQILKVTNGFEEVFLPENLKIECKQLKLSSSRTPLYKPEEHQLRTLQFIRQFLINTPLDKLSIIAYNTPDPIFQQKMVRTARNLEVVKNTPRDKSIVSELVQLTNHHIRVKAANSNFAEEDVVTLARSWLERCPKIGTRFTLRLGWECLEYVREVLELISPITVMKSGDELHIYKEYQYLVMEVRQSWLLSAAMLFC